MPGKHHRRLPLFDWSKAGQNRVAIGLLAVIAVSCATPVAPTGGPVDESPPQLISSDPPADAVLVSSTELEMTFSERVDAASFSKALSIVPDQSVPPTLRVRGRTATISLADSLLPNTTYLVTLDTELKDDHGVRLRRPVTFAFATGEIIDRGVIRGTVVDGGTGRPAAGIDVFAWMRRNVDTAFVEPLRAQYRTQTGPDGRFQFDYLPARSFYVVAVNDANSNRTFDEGELFAVPVVGSIAPVARDSADVLAPWILASSDTTSPGVRTVRARSAGRVEVRFSEPVHLLTTRATEWQLADSATARPYNVRAVYQLHNESDRVILWTDSLGALPFRLNVPVVRDTSGNISREETFLFAGSTRSDTLSARLIAFGPGSGTVQTLHPGQLPAFTLSVPVVDTVLANVVSATDGSGSLLDFSLSTIDNTTHSIVLSRPLEGDTLAVDIRSPDGRVDTTYVQKYLWLTSEETGTLSGYVSGEGRIVVDVVSGARWTDAITPAVVDSAGRYMFTLAEGNYGIRAFADRDSNGTWTGGYPFPYSSREPQVWSDTVRVRPKWETVVDTLILAN